MLQYVEYPRNLSIDRPRAILIEHFEPICYIKKMKTDRSRVAESFTLNTGLTLKLQQITVRAFSIRPLITA